MAAGIIRRDDPGRWRTEIAPFWKVASEADNFLTLEKRSMIRGANMKPVEFEAARRTTRESPIM